MSDPKKTVMGVLTAIDIAATTLNLGQRSLDDQFANHQQQQHAQRLQQAEREAEIASRLRAETTSLSWKPDR